MMKYIVQKSTIPYNLKSAVATTVRMQFREQEKKSALSPDTMLHTRICENEGKRLRIVRFRSENSIRSFLATEQCERSQLWYTDGQLRKIRREFKNSVCHQRYAAKLHSTSKYPFRALDYAKLNRKSLYISQVDSVRGSEFISCPERQRRVYIGRRLILNSAKKNLDMETLAKLSSRLNEWAIRLALQQAQQDAIWANADRNVDM